VLSGDLPCVGLEVEETVGGVVPGVETEVEAVEWT
jgi:hypothetical protein